MARIIIGLSVLLLSLFIMSTFGITLIKPSDEAIGTPEPRQFGQSILASNGTAYQIGGNGKQLQITEHKIQTSDIQRLKTEIGVYTPSENYNGSVGPYGTGCRPPTEEEWLQLVNSGYVVDKISFDGTISTASAVDHSKDPWFPPIGNQGQEGSCVCWAVGYYMKTYQEASEHNWSLTSAVWDGSQPSVEYQDRIISPAFIYNLVNEGIDTGSYTDMAINLICSIGASSWEQMPYNPGNYVTWPSEEAWREAQLYRGASSGYQNMYISDDAGLASLKTWIASGNLAVTDLDGSKIAYSDIWGVHSKLTSNDVLTLDNYAPPFDYEKWHTLAIVGYNDSFSYTEQGQTRFGALKIANSWGVGGGWENVPDGYFWISYNAMKQWIHWAEFYEDRIGYKPELAASFRITHSKRGECDIAVGVGSQTKYFNQYIWGGNQSFCANNILLDITEFKDTIPNVYGQQFYLDVYDGGSSATGTILKFAVEYADSTNPPISTVNGGHVYAYVTLPPLKTNWRTANEVNSDNDFLDGKVSIATDSNGYLYIAYEDGYPLGSSQAIFLQRSTDGGRSWSLVTQFHWVGYDCHNPSMAIDPYDNKIYIAYELEKSASDHDIYCCIYTPGGGENHVGVDTSSGDDRYPSITCEYQYGSSNWQYISYEYLYTYNDRDLMFAKSTNHGATWSLKKLHGDFPDYNVHAQTSITNAEGNIYIAYKWGADYDSPCEIRIDRSTDFGSTWTQFTDVDGLPNGCSYPSIAATHGGGTVMVAFQYAWSASDTDVWYSYSVDKGATWVKGLALFTSGLEDEKQPELTVDGGGATGTDIRGYFHVACKVGSYVKYAETIYSTPSSWSAHTFVSERWVGKSIAIATQYRNTTAEFHPYIAWNDERTNNIYCSTIGHVHNLNDGLKYDSIQEAINANETHDGDTLLAESRTYYADSINGIYISKAVNLVGENSEDTLVDGENSTLNAFYLNSTSFSLKNFTICHSGGNGIFIESCSNSTIYGNNITANSGAGIDLYHSSYNSFSGNSITANSGAGIYLALSSSNTISGNTITNNGGAGIWLNSSSNYNSIAGNNITANNFAGVRLDSSDNSTILGNSITGNNGGGIDVYSSSSNSISGNSITNDYLGYVPIAGIYLYSSCNNSISGNNVSISSSGPNTGIALYYSSSNNNIRENNITNNYYGIDLSSSSNNSMSGNNVTNNVDGIRVGASNNSISGNNIADNYVYGITVGSSGNSISGNNITGNEGDGIILSSNNSVCGNNIADNWLAGIHLYSNNSIIIGNNITANGFYGIEFEPSSNNNSLSGNNITANDGWGIYISSSSNDSVSGNHITNNWNGTYLSSSNNNRISDNDIAANNGYGIWLDSSSNNSIAGNNITSNTNYGIYLDFSSNNSIAANNITANNYAGVFLDSSGSNTVSGNTVTNNTYGTYLAYSSNNSVSCNALTKNGNGTYLAYSSNNSISGNNIEANNDAGIYLYYSSNNTVSGNNATANNNFAILLFAYSNNNSVGGNNITANNEKGIELAYSSNNSVSCNNIAANKNGVVLVYGSDNNIISGNNVANNGQFGIYLYSALNNTISGNSITANTNSIRLDYSSDNNSISGNNITNNDGDGICLYSSTSSNSVTGNNITNNGGAGISLYSSSNNSVSGNNITANNEQGIWGGSSNNNTISGNCIAANNGYGVSLMSSSGNSIYHNNFLNNNGGGHQAYSDNPNMWDDGYPSGGNYWSDCNRTDLYHGPRQNITGSDGIGDTPYVFGAQDNYPLVKPYPWAAHDVGITNVEPSQSIVEQGSNVSINVNVMIFNYGNNTETFNVTVLANQVIIGEIDNITLTSRNFTNLAFTWNTTDFAWGPYSISAHASAVPGETDTADNIFFGGQVLIVPATNSGGAGGRMPYMD